MRTRLRRRQPLRGRPARWDTNFGVRPKRRAWAACLGLMLFVAGCSEQTVPDGQGLAGSSPSPRPQPPTDQWLGQWNGPEGTFLRLSGENGNYEITVRNLDGPRIFKGSAAGEGVRFERDGIQETLRATNGRDTGMKWLADKSNCLTVRPGEGYCRD